MRKLLWVSILILGFNSLYSQSYDAEILEQKVHATITSKNTLVISKSLEIRINNRRGEDLTFFTINGSSIKEVTDIDAWITSLEGTLLNKLNKKEITKVSAVSDISLYEDDFVIYFTLRHNIYPYVLHIIYETQEKEFLKIVDWNPVYARDYPTNKAELVISVPTNQKILIKEKDIHYTQTVDESGYINYRWEAAYQKPLKREIYGPGIVSILPQVIAVPQFFTFGSSGSFDNWIEYGNWEFELLKGLNDLPEADKIKVNTLTNHLNDNKEKARALYHYLQDNTRYINVSLDIGGMKPYPASYVAYNKYGDCKALTNYMKSLLEEAGINSFYTNIMAGDEIASFYTDFPSMQFNHVFLMVPLEKDTVWLECTNQNMPFGYIGTFTQNRNAFIIDQDKSRIIRTPRLKEEDVKTTTVSLIDINLTGKSKAQISYHCMGESYEYLKTLTKEFDLPKQEEYLREQLHFPNFELTLWSFENPDRDTASINLNIELESNDFCKKYANDYVLYTFPSDLPDFEKPKDRKLQLIFDYPIWEVDSTTFFLPESSKMSFIPQDTTLSGKFGRYTGRYYQSGDSITASYSLIIYPGTYPIEEYPLFFKFIQDIRLLERKNHIIFTL